ncbi:MAG: GldG family protein [Magnetococcales bacterium]|nr:GldG family protein [Magnetococcales bacterium]
MEMNPKNRLNLQLQNGLFGLLVVSIFGVLAYASQRYQIRWDWTAGARHTLAEQSIRAVQSFPDGLTATAFAQSQGEQKPLIQELLEKYRAINPNLTIRHVDPDLNPAAARQEQIAMYGTIVLTAQERTEKITELDEQAITNALIRLAKGREKTIRFITGHGEHPILTDQGGLPSGLEGNGYETVQHLLKGEGYGVATIQPAQVENIPDQTALLVLAGPRKPLLPIEVERLTDWWYNHDGRLLILSDPQTTTGLEEMLLGLGVGFQTGTLIDPVARTLVGGPTNPLVTGFSPNHSITRNLNMAAVFPDAKGVEILALSDESSDPSNRIKRTALFSGADEGWLEKGSLDSGQVEFDSQSDLAGPITLGVAVESRESRLVVVGDSDFAADTSVEFSGNSDLFLNMIRWLAEDEHFIAIKPKKIHDSGLALQRGEGLFLFIGMVIGIPLLLLAMGLTIWIRRKQR